MVGAHWISSFKVKRIFPSASFSKTLNFGMLISSEPACAMPGSFWTDSGRRSRMVPKGMPRVSSRSSGTETGLGCTAEGGAVTGRGDADGTGLGGSGFA